MAKTKQTSKSKKQKFSLEPELGWQTVVILALLAMPRVVMHDLKLVDFDSVAYKVAAFLPYAIWLGFAVFRKNKRPFYDFLMLGIVFGVFLGVTHQINWTAAWGDDLPKLGGNLEGSLTPWVEDLIIRIGAFISSIFTGLFVGVVFGGIAWTIDYIKKSK